MPEQGCFIPPQNEHVGREDSDPQFAHSFKGNLHSFLSANLAGCEKSKRACFYCLDPNNLIANYKEWNKKYVKSKSVALSKNVFPFWDGENFLYEPFIEMGHVGEYTCFDLKRYRIKSIFYIERGFAFLNK